MVWLCVVVCGLVLDCLCRVRSGDRVCERVGGKLVNVVRSGISRGHTRSAGPFETRRTRSACWGITSTNNNCERVMKPSLKTLYFELGTLTMFPETVHSQRLAVNLSHPDAMNDDTRPVSCLKSSVQNAQFNPMTTATAQEALS